MGEFNIEDGLTYYYLEPDRYNALKEFANKNGYEIPEFTLFNGLYYFLAEGTNIDFILAEFDMEDEIENNDYFTYTWTKSTVPSVLWP